MRKEGLPIKQTLFCVLLIAALSGCHSTQYRPATPSGGFGEVELDGDIWRIRFTHNAFTTRETATSFWLYRAAELTLSKGYDGFEVLSQVSRSRSSGDGLGKTSSLLIEGEIRMLKKPFESVPPKTYNAEALKAVLDPYVAGAKSEPAPVLFRAETPPPSPAGLSLKMTYSIPEEPAKPAATPPVKPKPAPIVARPQAPPVAQPEPSLKRTGPCEVKPVMTDQDLVNCGARVR